MSVFLYCFPSPPSPFRRAAEGFLEPTYSALHAYIGRLSIYIITHCSIRACDFDCKRQILSSRRCERSQLLPVGVREVVLYVTVVRFRPRGKGHAAWSRVLLPTRSPVRARIAYRALEKREKQAAVSDRRVSEGKVEPSTHVLSKTHTIRRQRSCDGLQY